MPNEAVVVMVGGRTTRSASQELSGSPRNGHSSFVEHFLQRGAIEIRRERLEQDCLQAVPACDGPATFVGDSVAPTALSVPADRRDRPPIAILQDSPRVAVFGHAT
jgi:hypothetical protein